MRFVQDLLVRFGLLGPTAAVLLCAAGLTYGLFGWRIVRFLATVDAMFVGLFVGMQIPDWSPFWWAPPLIPTAVGFAVVFALCSWRFPELAVATMSGALGFLLVQMLIGTQSVPSLAVVMLCALGCGMAVAFQMSMYHHTAMVVTGIHGGCLVVAALGAILPTAGTLTGRLSYLLMHSSVLVPVLVVAFSAILILLQWIDLATDGSPARPMQSGRPELL